MQSKIREAKRTHLIAIMLGLAAVVASSSDAHARYNAGMNVYPGVTTPMPPRAPAAMATNFGRQHVGVNVYPSVPTPMPHPDGPNLYQYVQSSPINRVDPMGLWSDKVHYKGTYDMAKAVGFNKRCRKVLAEWNQGVDDWTGASIYPWYHFNKDVDGKEYSCGRDCWADYRWKKGVRKLKAAKVWYGLQPSVYDGLAHIGEALHGRQDEVTHSEKHKAETPFDHAPDIFCLFWGDGFGIIYDRCKEAKDTSPNWGNTRKVVTEKGTEVFGRGRPDDEEFWVADYEATLTLTRKLLDEIWKIPAVQRCCRGD